MNSKPAAIPLLPILLLGLGLRLICLDQPLFERDPAAWRQTQTDSTAQGYLRHGFRFWYPEVNFMGEHGYFAQEFPLYQYAVALLYRGLGESVVWARLLTIAASLAGLIYLFLSLRAFYGITVAAAAACYYAVVPLSAFYGRAVMIDAVAVSLALGGSYHFLHWLRGSRGLHLLAAVLLFSASVLIKATAALALMLPLLLLALLWREKAVWRTWHYYGLVLIPLLLGGSWAMYANHLNLRYATPLVNYDARGLQYWIFGPWEMRLDPFYYEVLWNRAASDALTWPGLMLAAAGAAVCLLDKRFRALSIYLAAGALYLLTFTSLNFIHDYYQLPLVPIAAAAFGALCGYLANQTGTRVLVYACVVWLCWSCIPTLLQQYGVNDQATMQAGQEVARLLPPQALVITLTANERPLGTAYPQAVIDNIQPKDLYAIGHRGWNMSLNCFDPSKIEELRRRHGARFLVADLLARGRDKERLGEAVVLVLRDRYREIASTARFLVYSLQERP